MSLLFNTSFQDLLLAHWDDIESAKRGTTISGDVITIADIVASSTYISKTSVTPSTLEAATKSYEVLDEKIVGGEVIYGVNTGYGGSADQRSGDMSDLQQNLFHLLLAGIIDEAPTDDNRVHGTLDSGRSETRRLDYSAEERFDSGNEDEFHDKTPLQVRNEEFDPIFKTTMPETWIRAAMLVRLQSLAFGASGVRPDIINSLVQLLNANIVPVTPLCGSISASGDLQPLAYLGALMQGKTFAMAHCGKQNNGRARHIQRADVALREAGIEPIEIKAKEGLAIVNRQCLNLLALSQLITAMTVEALGGSTESFHPFLSRMRPHMGQGKTAKTILHHLQGSRLTLDPSSEDTGKLRQDRYSTRTAPQWIGPIMEDFLLAHTQILTEMNSVTDNPLIDPISRTILHGGNFQAKAITSAVEKLRLGLQSLGRLSFSQLTELINPATNNGLPANLTANDPSKSFLYKGADIMAAALTSELGVLANPVGSHVQTAEMGNQGVNSLALVSARYTAEAVEVVSQLMAVQIVVLCQALELRAGLERSQPGRGAGGEKQGEEGGVPW
ncbi:hypothetical protein KVT40_006680 [Elsinoe batatas]|uniref:Phenylalanine ammonia-lyase n=1 Tax=Elsinoe batatas TaxID=2601811 RepID=A0A8K0PGU4_9PEZI|nr:hypothetical protein KVT40_006680 [Elsinoe batatas]